MGQSRLMLRAVLEKIEPGKVQLVTGYGSNGRIRSLANEMSDKFVGPDYFTMTRKEGTYVGRLK